jgi:molybdate-binding protein/DNA-binding XRE family transcriptional regulator
MESTKLAKTIRAVRTSRGLTQAQFAGQAGISRQALAAIESGAYLPNVAVAVKLARLAGKSVEELFGEVEESEHRIDARWKRSPRTTVDRTRVVLARVNGKMVAMARPSASLTLPVSSGVCLKHTGSGAQVVTSMLDSEIDATLVVAGCDPSVSMLIAWMARTGSRINAVSVPCSSGRALAGLADQSVHVAGAHLRDPKSGDYNLAQVRAAGRGRICLINFARWEVGLATANGNPRGIRNYCDLGRSNIRIVNRERGAGARQVLDEALDEAGLKPNQIKGYQSEAGGHLEVAAAISEGHADTGVTIRVAAEAYGLGFIALREERYDLAIPEAELEATPVSRMLDALTSRRFAREVAELCAYDTARMGEEIARVKC